MFEYFTGVFQNWLNQTFLMPCSSVLQSNSDSTVSWIINYVGHKGTRKKQNFRDFWLSIQYTGGCMEVLSERITLFSYLLPLYFLNFSKFSLFFYHVFPLLKFILLIFHIHLSRFLTFLLLLLALPGPLEFSNSPDRYKLYLRVAKSSTWLW